MLFHHSLPSSAGRASPGRRLNFCDAMFAIRLTQPERFVPNGRAA